MEHKDILQKVKCCRLNAVGLEESMKQSRGGGKRPGGWGVGAGGDAPVSVVWLQMCYSN